MNSRVEPKFRDVDDARGKLVSLTAGAGFKLLVKQALAPGEPLQIDIGDGNLLVLSRYRLPVGLGHSFGAEGVGDGIAQGIALRNNARRPEDTAISPEEAPGTDSDGPSGRLKEDRGGLRTGALLGSARDRSGLVLVGIGAAIGISAIGILWGGIGGDHANAVRVEKTKRATESKAAYSVEPPAAAAGAPQPGGHSGSTASFPGNKKFPGEASIATLASKPLPVPAITRMKAAPIMIDSTQPARLSKVAVVPGLGAANRISIKASDTSWVTACADGVRVLGRAFNKGESGEVRFSSRAAVHSGNAGAIELSIGEKPIGPMGKWGEVRTINATPAGYEFVTTTPASDCHETTPEKLTAIPK